MEGCCQKYDLLTLVPVASNLELYQPSRAVTVTRSIAQVGCQSAQLVRKLWACGISIFFRKALAQLQASNPRIVQSAESGSLGQRQRERAAEHFDVCGLMG